MYVMEQTTMQGTGDDHDDQSITYLCVEGMHRVMALKMAGYEKPVRFTLVRQLSVDDMIFTGARLNQQGDKRYFGNLISELETHRRALECIVEKELQKHQNSGPEVWLEIASKVKPSDIWHLLDPHDYKEKKGLNLDLQDTSSSSKVKKSITRRGTAKGRVHNLLKGGAPNKYRLPHALIKRLTTSDFEKFITFLKNDYDECNERELAGLPQKYPSTSGSSGYRLSLTESGLDVIGGYLERIEPDYPVDFSTALFLVMKWIADEYRDEKSVSAPTITRIQEICRRVVGAIQEKQRVSEYFWPQDDPILGHWPASLENYFNSLLSSQPLIIDHNSILEDPEMSRQTPGELADLLDHHFRLVTVPKKSSEATSRTNILDFNVRKRDWCILTRAYVIAALGIPPEKKAQLLSLYETHKGSIKALEKFVEKNEALLRPPRTPSPPP